MNWTFVGVRRRLSLVGLARRDLTPRGAEEASRLPPMEANTGALRRAVCRDQASRIRRWRNGKKLSKALLSIMERAA